MSILIYANVTNFLGIDLQAKVTRKNISSMPLISFTTNTIPVDEYSTLCEDVIAESYPNF